MARVHQWFTILNENGEPLQNANFFVYLAGGTTTSGDATYAANLFDRESGGTAFQSYRGGSDIIQSDTNGFVEFWIADEGEASGYATDQKFKYVWNATGITEKTIDNVDVFPLVHEVDETDTSVAKNKVVSNYLAKSWTEKVDVFTTVVSAGEWLISASDYCKDIEHSLGNEYPMVQLYSWGGEMVSSTPLTAASLSEDQTRLFVKEDSTVRVIMIG